MLFKGWHRLFHDLIGREGPFLETLCVPFAGLAILLWPAIVVGSILVSIVSSVFLGAYAGIVAYQVIILCQFGSTITTYSILFCIFQPNLKIYFELLKICVAFDCRNPHVPLVSPIL